MKVPNAEHTARPWRIREIAHDFRLEDVWELPTAIGADDLPRLVAMIGDLDPTDSSLVVRTLFAARLKLGRLFGWDGEDDGIGARVPTLRDRLPPDLQDGPTGWASDTLPFTPLYLTEDEWAAEIANRTMHGLIHLGRVPDGADRYRAQMAIYVKPNGLLGSAYMTAIRPFRYLAVYPHMLREIDRRWRAENPPADGP